MSEITGRTTAGMPSKAIATVHESYSFACMRCGHGWEQSYDIEHYVDGSGNEFVMYVVNGERVPSPLTRPTCLNCGGHVVRIMKAGQVSSVLDMLRKEHHSRRTPKQDRGEGAAGGGEAEPDSDHHWHLSDLLHPFRGHHHKPE
ncbi:hypothetical protein ACFQVC_18300 [Streptomyces monticola]|uniref:Uncharacterized protein n=1 Tax=Streptomyces monticola TaxID=2666263 RepID=A0ABW2JLE0_9ACTN